MHNSLSVNINVDANLHRSQSAIKLTFSSTINGHAAQPVSQQSQQMTPMSDLCKSELDATPGPGTDPAAVNDPQSSEFTAAAGDSMDNLEYLDELSDLLDKLEEDPRCFDAVPETNVSTERPVGPPSISRDVVGTQGRYSSAAPLYPPAYNCGTTAFSSPASTDTPAAAAAAPGCVGLMGGTASAPTLLGDTGPAAETLKQMAAQHQSLHESSVVRHYGYPDGYHPTAAFRDPSGAARMPRYRAVLAGAGGYMMPAGTTTMCPVDPRAAAAAGYGPVYPDGAQYRAAAPSSAARFVGVPQHGHCVTSSLQRLETQVRSQFAPMPVTPSPLSTDSQHQQQQQQHFRLEQSQRVDVRAPGQVVVARQQQSFVMSMDTPQQQQPQQPSQRAYPPPANPAAYSHYPRPVGYPMTAAPFGSASGTVPGGYGGMPARMPSQQAVGVPPSYAAVQAHDQDNTPVVSRPPNSTRVHPGRASSSSYVTPAAARGLPQSTSAGTQLPTKVEAGVGVGYAVGDVAAAADSGGMKVAADAPANANYGALSHAKLTHPQQRPPNVTVVPGPAGAMNFHPHAGGAVKWMPSAVARHPYAGGYAMDTLPSRQSDNTGPAGWSLSMSQTQSLYMSNSAGDAPYHLSGPSNSAAAGYPPAGSTAAVQSADPSRMQRIPTAVGSDVVFQRNAAAPGQLYKDTYNAAYNSRDYAFTDTVFVSK